jgi:hypothetical protein
VHLTALPRVTTSIQLPLLPTRLISQTPLVAPTPINSKPSSSNADSISGLTQITSPGSKRRLTSL